MLWPDVIFSDGLCRALLRWATEGYQLVLFASLRHVQESVLEELSQRGLLSLDARPSQTCQALIISPRLLADISIRHLHPEILPYEFGNFAVSDLPRARLCGDAGWARHRAAYVPWPTDHDGLRRDP